MTVKIEIVGETAEEALRELQGLTAGLIKAQVSIKEGTPSGLFSPPPISLEPRPHWHNVPASEADQQTAFNADPAENTNAMVQKEPEAEPAEAPKRTRAKKGTKAVPAEAPQISTNPESRVGPEDDAEIDAQDEADEQAEVEAKRDPEKPLTAEDLKNAAGAYVQKFGMEACQLDGAKLLTDVLGKPPGDESYWKISTIAGLGQDHLRKAIDAWDAAVKSDSRYQGKEG